MQDSKIITNDSFNKKVIIIGFGSIGVGVLPLILRHFPVLDRGNIVIFDPNITNKKVADSLNIKFKQVSITSENYRDVLTLEIKDSNAGFILNLANEVSSEDLIKFAASKNYFYIDTVVEPWPGFYFETNTPKALQTNYALRESLHKLKSSLKDRSTAISCSGANPGMISWLLKEALLQLATDLDLPFSIPTSKNEWASLMMNLGIHGIHIAERDSQISDRAKNVNEFVNTWSVDGCVAECLQPAELGWGTSESSFPSDGYHHEYGSKCAIYLDKPGGDTKVQTWTPTQGSHTGYVITHNEAISIADFYTVRNGDEVLYRPTCHYSYHPSDDTVASLTELFRDRGGLVQTNKHIQSVDEIISGAEELGVLLYGHERGAFWFGSQLSIEETRRVSEYQNATGLQVTSAVIASMIYCLENPNLGLIETDEMDHVRCLEIQRYYLGTVKGYYTEWQPERKEAGNIWDFNNMRLT